MKKLPVFMAITAALGLTLSCSETNSVEILGEGLRYSESTYPYDGGILVASFGTEELNPLNSEGKGYIMKFKDGKSEMLIPADGNLSAPKGMLVDNGRLFICDVNKIVVYDLEDKGRAPQIINMGEGNLFVNDLVAVDGFMYASVTNSDKIFKIDISSRDSIGMVQEWLTVKGPNGLALRDGKMYIASYPADGVTTDNNVLYVVDDLSSPVAAKFGDIPGGQYDGLAFSEDGKYLYFTNWTPAQVSVMDMVSGNVEVMDLGLDVPLTGPADISLADGRLYIPDLPASRVVVALL